MPSVTVAYLVWAPLGLSPVERFIHAYRLHAAGEPHQLLILLNGFSSPADAEPFKRLFEDVPHQFLLFPSKVFDLAAYFAAAEKVDSDYILFLNSYSVPLVSNWLRHFMVHADTQGAGILGATGSYESPYSTMLDHRPLFRPSFVQPWPLNQLREWRALRLARKRFPPFPNPHLRSNAFLIRRDRMLGLQRPRLDTKFKTFLFESGWDGMTRQLISQGLEPLIVGADGKAYPIPSWRESATFRSGGQRNLLISDNRTEHYRQLEESEQQRWERLTWGAHATVPAMTTNT